MNQITIHMHGPHMENGAPAAPRWTLYARGGGELAGRSACPLDDDDAFFEWCDGLVETLNAQRNATLAKYAEQVDAALDAAVEARRRLRAGTAS